MLAHSPPSTSRSHSLVLDAQKLDFDPYVPTSDFVGDEGFTNANSEGFTKVEVQVLPSVPPKRSHSEGITNIYGAIARMLGFNEKYSLGLLIFFGGALIGFCLANTPAMNPVNLPNLTIPGEWFWYRQSLFKPCIFIHVYLSIISGFFAVFQFIPGMRRRSMILHRINGYLTLALLIPSTICGSIVARRAFGGELNVQSSFYVDGCLIVFAAFMGITNAKRNTRKHRKWMLRTVVYAAVPVTGRLTSVAARRVISNIGSYYAVWRCDEILYVLRSMDASQQSYPECTQAGRDPANVHVAIRAAVDGDKFGLGSSVRVTWGMAMWIAIVIHVLGVEIYIRLSESSNRYRRGFVLQRDDDMEE